MPKYLDPRNDVVFKKVFGDNPPILIDFLNALLPIDTPIESIEYLTPEQTPDVPEFKHTIVDVKCKDRLGHQFIVEMQLDWTSYFMQRVLFNACKAYSRQPAKGEGYDKLRSVFALSLINDVFLRDTDEYYHHYALRHSTLADKKLEGVEFVFIELPKFKPTGSLKHSELWLRFLTEINEEAIASPSELIQTPPFTSAIRLAETMAYNRAELEWYEKWEDAYRTQITLLLGKEEKAYELGETKGKAEGKAEGIELGEARIEVEMQFKTARAMKAKGLPIDMITEITGLSAEKIESLYV